MLMSVICASFILFTVLKIYQWPHRLMLLRIYLAFKVEDVGSILSRLGFTGLWGKIFGRIEEKNLAGCWNKYTVDTNLVSTLLAACSEGYKWWSYKSRITGSCSCRLGCRTHICGLWISHYKMYIWCCTEAAVGDTYFYSCRTMWQPHWFSFGSNTAIQWILHCS